jgi:SAM-dependent methyltransferase
MLDLLRDLPPEAKVLDLGCGNGSFNAAGLNATVVRVDLETSNSPPPNFVRADASNLPFATRTFDAVISNHSLEHVENLDGCLNEISRVLKPDAMLYVAVPDSTTVCDRLYRWLASGGGHVNPFPSATDLSHKIETATALPHLGTRTLCTSFSFLNRKLIRARIPGKLLLLGGGTQTSLLMATYTLRLLDRFLGTRLIVYGWALYFGKAPESSETWTNVCILCGSGQDSSSLVVFRKLLLPFYRCPQCGTLNLFTRDEHYTHLASGVSLRLRQ